MASSNRPKSSLLSRGIEAAKRAGLTEVPYLLLPDGVNRIQHAIRCNEDGTDTSRYDVFDYAELCWKLGNQEAQRVLGWSAGQVSKHSGIVSKLHSLAWETARFPNIYTVGNFDAGDVGNGNFPIGNWSESHFRALLSHLSLNGHRDNAVLGGQLWRV